MGDRSLTVFLHVYDLMDESRPTYVKNLNWYMYALGLGLYHSGIEFNGQEFGFGGHNLPGTGVFENHPKQAEGATFRETVELGETKYTIEEVESIIAELSFEYSGRSYNLFSRNCNHFADDLGFRLTGVRAPAWINRLSSYGETFKCWMPDGMDAPHMAPVVAPTRRLPQPPEQSSEGEQDELRSAGDELKAAGDGMKMADDGMKMADDDLRSAGDDLVDYDVVRTSFSNFYNKRVL